MSDFNQIFINSSLNVNQEELAVLCFNNGKIISKTKYSLENHMLSLLEDTSETISLYYNNNIAQVYEFTVLLNKDDKEFPIYDDNQKAVKTLIQDRLLVFVDGILGPADRYYVKDDKILVFKHKRQDANTHKVIVYSSTVNFERQILTSESINLDNIYCPNYSTNRIMLFADGIKIDFNRIELLKTSSQANTSYIKLNLEDTDINSLEIISFFDSLENLQSLNFESTQGYLTYGPYDDYGNKIPNMYDIEFVLNDQAKIVVDDIRPGFIIKEINGPGEAIIVDEIFEKRELHGLMLQPFTQTSYLKDEFYLKVPEYKSIVNYLSEFDTKYTFIPEILTIFQRLLLDEIKNTIQRLKNSRSIQKVDSTQINKLLQLLGCNLNTKRLTLKQRRELLEELNEFYRITGTRNSYNLLNILQNDLKLINIEQLFTPFDASLKSKNKTVYYYTSQISEGGSGYKVDDILRTFTSTGKLIEGKVTKVDPETGEIIDNGFKPVQSSGYIALTGYNLPLSTGINDAVLDVKSTENTYRYVPNVSQSSGYAIGQILTTADGKFSIYVDNIDSQGKITSYTLSPQTGTEKVSLNAVDLILQAYSIEVGITSQINSDIIISQNTYKYSDLNKGEYEFRLEPGAYTITISGAGGSGGQGDTSVGWNSDVVSENGYAGELKTKNLNLQAATTIKGKIGQGGGAVHAIYTGVDYPNGVRGDGYQAGSAGGRAANAWSERSGWFGHTNKSWVVGGGVGGGSSSLQVNGETIVAKGGNGGGCGPSSELGNVGRVEGGAGGSGGTKSGTGAKGGTCGYHRDSFCSDNGSDGYITITRYKLSYKASLSGDTDKVHEGETFIIQTNNQTFTGVIHKVGIVTNIDITPTSGNAYINQNVKINVANDTAKLTLVSEPIYYNYLAELRNVVTDYLKVGDMFVGNSDHNEFRVRITNIFTRSDGKKTYTISYEPMGGSAYEERVDLNAIPMIYQTGTGAKLNIVSNEYQSQSTLDRCYIDFRTKEELGAEKKKEYRVDKIDYGVLTEGTPHSPRWWIPGEPDINYGLLSEETNKKQDLDYGYIRDKVKGEWVEWWEWDRDPEWYPTNHVVTEIKMPTDTDFREFTKTFVEQFYKLASAVVYIHSIVESFYFGSNVAGNSEKNKNSALFGIALGAPVMFYEYTVTSNPYIQYLEPTPTTCKLTIIPTPSNSLVTMKCDGETITGTGTCEMEVDYGKTIEWSVEKAGYVTYAEERVMTKTITKRVVLAPEYNPATVYHTLTINPTPSDATVTFDVGEVTGNTTKVPEDTTINWTVNKELFLPQTGTVDNINEDTTLNIELEPMPDYTLTVVPTPNDATVTLSASGYGTVSGTGEQSITVLGNTMVEYNVSAENYATKRSSIRLLANNTIPVVLKAALDLEDYEFTTTVTDNVSLTNYIGSNASITTPHI